MARQKKGEVSVPQNSATAEQALEIVEGIEKEKDGLLDLHMDYMRDCQPFHANIKGIIEKGVKVYGMTRRAIAAKVKEREHLRKADEQRKKLDSEEAIAFDRLSEQLGELGKAARQNFRRAAKEDPVGDFAAA
jgi:hypothetical protein